jgi:hypothetical protein
VEQFTQELILWTNTAAVAEAVDLIGPKRPRIGIWHQIARALARVKIPGFIFDLISELAALFLILLLVSLHLIFLDAFPFDIAAVAAWALWWAIRQSSMERQPLFRKPIVAFAARTVRPLLLCFAIAITPHAAFLALWSILPVDVRLHSLIERLPLGSERIVLGLHEDLRPYEDLGWAWWAAIVLTVGWIAVEFSRPWLLGRFLRAERWLSRMAFTIGLAVCFTATTLIKTPAWDPNATPATHFTSEIAQKLVGYCQSRNSG